MKVFWSWQNDYAPKACRHFVREALEEAVNAVGTELGLEDADRPELDHDTKGTPGMADITKTILDKISGAAVFVADVTPIAETAAKKALPNPNVLIELGWAMKAISPERIITIINTASGYVPDDLPFDIRHRRVMPYALAEQADKKTRDAAKKMLVKDLTAALRVNLGSAVDEKTAAQEITGKAAAADDPSVWASAKETLEHHDSLGQNHKRTIAMPRCPRGYMRIIPAGWKSGPPSVNDIAQLQDGAALWPQTEGTSSGDRGVCEDGFVRYWHTGENDKGEAETRNVVMYFDDTGEFWVTHGTAIVQGPKGKMLRVHPLLQGWARTLKSGLSVMNRFQSSPVIKVEAGLVGVKDVRWPGNFEYEATPARKDRCVVQRQAREWDEEAQRAFLLESYNKVRDLFGFTKATPEDLRKLLGN